MTAQSVKWWSLVHKWTSLVCTLFLLMLCITGLPLIFHDEIDELFKSEASARELPADTPQAPLSRLVDAAKARYPQRYLQVLGWDDDRANVVNVFLSATPEAPPGQRFLKLSFDSRTAELIGEDAQQGGLMSAIRIFHRDMFLGLPGELFLGVMGVLFVIAIVSGIVLYAPFMRRLSFGTVRRASASRVKWLDLHNLIGGVTLIWLLAVGVTGVINTISLPLFSAWRAGVMPELIAPHAGKPPLAKWADVDDVIATARRAIDGNTPTSIIFPTVARFGTPRHFIVWTKGSTPITSRLFTPAMLDAETGQLVTARGLPWYLRALQVSRPLHFGDYGGLPLKIIWALLDLAAIVVLGSGVYLWLGKRKSPRVTAPVEGRSPVVATSGLRS
ncbi:MULTISPECIES: PepSY domain-containing protein [Bradyrhizobium]|uniref:PepSY-associated TM helix domain-containing protein n=1 Tax=Bradyrhizobium TaxID=374 RepID=UPI0004107E38|nr:MULTISPECIES: PepSY-associated TM helix domain-containing protein [Bradyrhizobium]MBR1003608.1 PepSY domain-containing protein [Bradyrhizobium liaoningense]MBR1031656.1 PepSY domain-containing protein [Bradyrhizobium liaoningense]MBR1069391.1 PepSY domain-containing protein [Bradyrhizobium liaoningense]MCP1741807.1 putative iron-regulated membrane protein [Bradyrhizobium japonicum]MCP1859517.1 putative iron-regulated membrane protein [Bradyrhizobium japonicum]